MNEYDQLIGEKVRQQRKLKKLSLEEVACVLKVSAQSVSRFEKGVHSLSAYHLGKISHLLGYEFANDMKKYER